ncbi:MAG TPA: hypothetical protein VLA42_18250 [Verrucomicrobiae bacterium]|jgi:hypothetical protein|nr:hypothetical protein [Verrucomicrobiae bacterium]
MPRVKTSRIAKLVKDYVQTETRLLRTLLELKSFYGERAEVRKAYLDATFKTPEGVAESVWALLAGGDEPAEWFDEVLLNLAPDAKNFHTADAILTWCAEKGWSEQVQTVMNEDTKLALADRAARGEMLADAAFAAQIDSIDWTRPSDGTHEDLLKLLDAKERESVN